MSFRDIMSGVSRTMLAAFGEAVTYAPSVGAAATPIGIFSERYVLVQAGQAGVETIGPAVFFKVEDLPVDPEIDEPTLTIRGVGYRVTERRPDGMGGIVLGVRRIT